MKVKKGGIKLKKVKLSLFMLFIILGIFLAGCNSNQGSESTEKGNQDNQNEETNDAEKAESADIAYYFTANEGGSISKIDAATNEVASTIDVAGSVHNVQVSPDGKMIGATVMPEMADSDDSMEMNGQAWLFDTETDERLQVIEVGKHPAHIVFTENGKYALVTNNEDDSVTVIDMASFEVVETIGTGKGPHGFRITADSQKAYIANIGEDTVSVVNLDTMKEEKRIKVGKTPVTTGISSDGKTLAVPLSEENVVAIVDLATDQVEKIPVGKGPAQVYIDINNEFAYVANQGTEDAPSNSVSVVDLATKKVTATIETGKGTHGVVTSPDNKWLYATNQYEDTVSVIDIEQKKVIDTIEVGETPNGISIMNTNK